MSVASENEDGFMLTGDAAGAAEPTAEMPQGWPEDEVRKQGAKAGDDVHQRLELAQFLFGKRVLSWG